MVNCCVRRKTDKVIKEEFENRSLKLLFGINSTIGNLLNNNNNNNFYNVKESGIYQLISPNCNKRYIGHHNIFFLKILKTIFNRLNMGMTNPHFSQYLIKKWTNNGPHLWGILHITKKGRHTETLEKLQVGGGGVHKRTNPLLVH
jgi:hypothetical protein